MTLFDRNLEQALDRMLADAPEPIPADDLVRRIVVQSVTLAQVSPADATGRARVMKAVQATVPRLLSRPVLGGALAASLVLITLSPWHFGAENIEAGMDGPSASIAARGSLGPSLATAEVASAVLHEAHAANDASRRRTAIEPDRWAVRTDETPALSDLEGPLHDASANDAASEMVMTPAAAAAATDFKLAASAPDEPGVYGPVLEQPEPGLTPISVSSGAMTGRAVAPSQ